VANPAQLDSQSKCDFAIDLRNRNRNRLAKSQSKSNFDVTIATENRPGIDLALKIATRLRFRFSQPERNRNWIAKSQCNCDLARAVKKRFLRGRSPVALKLRPRGAGKPTSQLDCDLARAVKPKSQSKCELDPWGPALGIWAPEARPWGQ
jgi:hypothetical protein